MNKAIFLDRDGTINEDVGDLYLSEQLKFIPKSLEALKTLQKEFLLFIVTNQSGIGKGSFNESQFLAFDKYYRGILAENEIVIQQTYCCPHIKEDACKCRKPSPFYLIKSQKQYNIDLGKSFVIGDHPHDIETAYNAGTRSIYVLSGHGKKHRDELTLKPNLIANNLFEATLWIAKLYQQK